ncbi:MAG: 16S rRNA (cytosine(1402)-N(4))-methyltransferase RsmH [Phycisphaerae bacterium]|nr:16S rRNA (cytosine(1402)-N(4))-methyltransferase RsmH [Phycisphaerae bacterium]
MMCNKPTGNINSDNSPDRPEDETFIHRPVLMKPLLEILDFNPEAVVVDATVGQGGHSFQMAERLSEKGRLIGLDVDPDSLEAAANRLSNVQCPVTLIRSNFGRLDEVLTDLKIDGVDVILADIGISSAQLANKERGISFQEDGPLDMRLDDRLETTAADLVHTTREEELADLIYQYGEERKSRRIARAIVEARRIKTIKRTGELLEIVNAAVGFSGGWHKSKIHPATRTFQALRIAVNDELGQLERLLAIAPKVLREKGQIAIISFHSLEDRIVKYNFRDNKQNEIYKILTKKPVIADEDERRVNPRSRSAKMRVARKAGIAEFTSWNSLSK